MITTSSVAISPIVSREVSNVHGGIHCVYVGKICWSSLNRPLSVMIDVDCSIHIIVISITLNRHAIFMLDRVTSPTILSLLSKFSLSDGLYV